ncbi:Diadenosine tetraphosphate (Ap4A) hydrolase and other HIT family hydrolases [hydrothermal vent metagenome]|uniref:Diadenosine tetraphosphate (Ap4A) hydrolase and other HIT family hydrolases n=1 Tax=hydrothermal vent metagenome TaxID=652676 RepID=A0A1W1D3S7_9ZZZZ
MIIYKDNDIYIEKEQSEIPWLKVFTNKEYKELSDAPKELRLKLWDVCNVVEEVMRAYYNPTKINLASFANMLPRIHFHIMARFENDSYFPNPMWGEKLRKGSIVLKKDEEEFFILVREALTKRYNL